jgi:putative flippase GtrA
MLGHLWNNRVIRFLIVGGSNTLFGYSVFALSYLVLERHDLALALSVSIGVVFNFFSIGKVVFRTLPRERFLIFCLNYGAAFLVNYLMLSALIHLGVAALIAQVICLPFFVTVSYLLNARLVFHGRESKSP